MSHPLRVLVIGGSGLIGGPTTRALVAAGHTVSVLTRGQRPVDVGCAAIAADRRDADSLARALSGKAFDLTVDLQAYDDADVARLLDVPGLQPGRYVLISTGQVYLVAAERSPPFVEADSERPARPRPPPDTRDEANWVYGMGKRAAEAEVARRRGAGSLDAVILRLPVVHGANDASRRLWAYVQRLLDGGPILLPDGGRIPVRYVWAEDVGRLVALLVGGLPTPSLAYNVAMPDEPPLADFLLAVARHLGVQTRLIACSEAELAAVGIDDAVSPFSGPWCSRPDPGLLARELGFRCTPSAEWLPTVLDAHLAEVAPVSHDGYANRHLELEWARGR